MRKGTRGAGPLEGSGNTSHCSNITMKTSKIHKPEAWQGVSGLAPAPGTTCAMEESGPVFERSELTVLKQPSSPKSPPPMEKYL